MKSYSQLAVTQANCLEQCGSGRFRVDQLEYLTVDVQPKAEEVKQRNAGEVWLIPGIYCSCPHSGGVLANFDWGETVTAVARPLDSTASNWYSVDACTQPGPCGTCSREVEGVKYAI